MIEVILLSFSDDNRNIACVAINDNYQYNVHILSRYS